MFAGIHRVGAEDGWYETSLRLELAKLLGDDYIAGAVDRIYTPINLTDAESRWGRQGFYTKQFDRLYCDLSTKIGRVRG